MLCFTRNYLITEIKKAPFSLATDGFNDNGMMKMILLTVRIFDANQGRIKTSLLEMCMSKREVAEELFTNIDNCMSLYGVSWDNCAAVGVDNADVNM